MVSQSEISFCVDTFLVESILSNNDKFQKKAGLVADLLSRIKSYFMEHIDKENPTASVLKLLAPGALWVLMQGIGLGKWGFFLGLLTDYLHIDIPSILSSMFEGLKGAIGKGEKISSEQIDAVGQQVAQQNVNNSDDHKIYSSLELLDEARFISLALIEYEHQKLRLMKEGGDVNNLLGMGGARSKSTSLLVKIVGWIFKIALASAGLMVAGDVANNVMGNPNALTGNYQEGHAPTSTTVNVEAPNSISKQTKFQFKNDGSLPSTWPIVNNQSNIENMVIQFTKDTYQGLDGKENIIRNTPGFKAIVQEIVWYNIHNPGTAVTMIPGGFGTKKHLVDYFIDDVANASP